MIYLEDNKSLKNLKPQIVLAIITCYEVYKYFKGHLLKDMTVVDINKSSFKLYLKGLPASYQQKAVDQIKECLGLNFNIILEEDHIYVEYDSKE